MSNISEIMTGKDLFRLKALFEPVKLNSGASVEYTGVFQVIQRDYGLGRLISGKLKLTPEDIRKVRSLVKKQSGFDLLCDPIPSSRTEASRFFSNEKIANTAVKGKVVKVYGVSSTNINGRTYCLEEGMVVEMPFDLLVSIQHQTIVLVENYEAFRQFRDAKLDLPMNPLIVYRGDIEGGVISKDFALKFPEAQLIAWFDADPAGISFALASDASMMIVPDLSEDQLKAHGRSSLFDNQHRNWGRVSGAIPPKLQQLMSGVGKGITQESMLENGVDLVLHPIGMDLQLVE
ncbi:hypothetical protein HX770_11585 [Vibrio parahaemolyticus]|uniref:DUF7281 domain-containing protein n=1 Tax=Vibrio TaxID=662 RepID=UPI0015B5DD7D|nr:hypothetical protein [Vibrio parahaemolyticus]NWJ65007.1 hypothetical protein [Vibrio parahaemolyticus]QLE30245.1 hypothetical protein FDV78_06460 [Vibrio parahaemolyticus]